MTPPDQDRSPLFQLPVMAGFSSDRGRVIGAAADLVTAEGNLELPWELVAKRSGVHEDVVRRLFPTTDALLAATLTLVDSRNATRYYGSVDGEGWAGLEVFVALMGLVAKQEGNIKAYSRLRFEAIDPQHAAHEWLMEHREANYDVLINAVQTGIDKGEMTADINPQLVAQTLLGIAEGIQLQWLASKGKVPVQAAVRDYVDLLRSRYATENFKA